MKNKYLALILAALMILSVLLTACGEDSSDALKDGKKANETTTVSETTAVSETTVVLETTSEGGTVEKDSEGNKITKDKDGNITHVEDKEGNTIEITEYITTHTWIVTSLSENTDSDDGSAKSGNAGSSSDSSGSNSNKQSSDGTKPNATNNVGSDGAHEDDYEDEVPVIIATIPNESDYEELPDL